MVSLVLLVLRLTRPLGVGYLVAVVTVGAVSAFGMAIFTMVENR